jgi:hypothetical protein
VAQGRHRLQAQVIRLPKSYPPSDVHGLINCDGFGNGRIQGQDKKDEQEGRHQKLPVPNFL